MSLYRIIADAAPAGNAVPPRTFKSQAHAYNLLETAVEDNGGSIEGAYLRRGVLHIHGKFNGFLVRWRIEQIDEVEA